MGTRASKSRLAGRQVGRDRGTQAHWWYECRCARCGARRPFCGAGGGAPGDGLALGDGHSGWHEVQLAAVAAQLHRRRVGGEGEHQGGSASEGDAHRVLRDVKRGPSESSFQRSKLLPGRPAHSCPRGRPRAAPGMWCRLAVLRSERPARHAAPSPLLRTFCRDATGATATRRLATRALGAATLKKLLVWRAAICVCALDEGKCVW